MKIGVYQICKNEIKHIKRWYNSIKDEQDGIFVTDTGSEDGSIEFLRQLGVTVDEQQVSPWRFDLARNLSLMNVPNDYDVVLQLDMDEVMQPGWRKQIEEEWEEDVTSLRYPYVFSWKDPEMTIPNITMYNFKIHRRHGFVWKYPVHEILEWTGDIPEKEKVVESIKSYHYQDLSKPRPYQKLLDDAQKEYPNDQRIQHLRGRELFMYNRFDEAIEQLKYHLKITEDWFYEKEDPDSIKQTRSLSMRYIQRSIWGKIQKELQEDNTKNIKDYDVSEILMWNLRQVQEFPWSREQWVWLSQFWQMLGAHHQQFGTQVHALTITDKKNSVENEDICWGDLPLNLVKQSKQKLPEILKTLGIEDKED